MGQTLEEIIAAAQRAKADQERSVLQSALEFARDAKWITDEAFEKAWSILDAGGSLDVAMGLVPDALAQEPAWWGVQRGGLTYFHAWVGTREPYDADGNLQGHWAQANGPALALVIAALKAHRARSER